MINYRIRKNIASETRFFFLIFIRKMYLSLENPHICNAPFKFILLYQIKSLAPAFYDIFAFGIPISNKTCLATHDDIAISASKNGPNSDVNIPRPHLNKMSSLDDNKWLKK